MSRIYRFLALPSPASPAAVQHRCGFAHQPARPLVARRRAPASVRLTVDPTDHRRALISGGMREVCEALDRLIQQQGAAPA